MTVTAVVNALDAAAGSQLFKAALNNLLQLHTGTNKTVYVYAACASLNCCNAA